MGLARQRKHLIQGDPRVVRDVGVNTDRVDDPTLDERLQRPDQVGRSMRFIVEQ